MSEIGFYFYTGDWLKDTRVITPEARGGWIDLLCELWEHGGVINWSVDEFARYWSCDSALAMSILRQLHHHKIADISCDCDDDVTHVSRICNAFVTPMFASGHTQCHGVVTLMSRRILRELNKRESNRIRKQRQRERTARHRNVTRNVTPGHTASSYSSSSPTPKKDKERIPSFGHGSSGAWDIKLRDQLNGSTSNDQHKHETEDEAKERKRLMIEAGLRDQDEEE